MTFFTEKAFALKAFFFFLFFSADGPGTLAATRVRSLRVYCRMGEKSPEFKLWQNPKYFIL